MGRSCAVLAISIAKLTSFTILAACVDEKKPAPGEVMLVVSTDMAVPFNIDTIRYAVTVGIGPTAMDAGAGTLDPAALPGTFGIASGRDPSVPVRIALDGLQGATLRVHREAILTSMPPRGVKMLSMPLDWLCSDANTCGASPCSNVNACGPGTTCKAGECADSHFTPATLPDYVGEESAACPGAVRDCFESAAQLLPTRDSQDPKMGCVVSIPAVAAPVNVALVVKSGDGDCGAVGCLIPLDNGPVDGASWEGWFSTPVSGGVIRRITLPSAVCDDINRGTIANVAVTTACPVKRTNMALCPLAPRRGSCVAWRPVVSDLGGCSDSLGYACPLGPPLDSRLNGHPTQDGLHYCATVAPGETLIDDMSGFPQIKFSPPLGDPPGHWFTAPASSSFILHAPGAACISSSGLPGQPVPAREGFHFVELPDGTLGHVDASKHTGISFWAFSPYEGPEFKVGFYTDAPCAAGQCGPDLEIPSTLLTCGTSPCAFLHNSWVRYEVSWAAMKKQGPFDETHLVGAYFAASAPAFDFCVSQIYFTP